MLKCVGYGHFTFVCLPKLCPRLCNSGVLRLLMRMELAGTPGYRHKRSMLESDIEKKTCINQSVATRTTNKTEHNRMDG